MRDVALVGMACRYPDARTPGELWENVLAQRRAFRRLPPERLRLEDYYASSPDGDRTTCAHAALIEGYQFDRARYHIGGGTFRVTDIACWLALDVAAEALADAGFDDGLGLPKETTGVLVGNTLTGELSRAHSLRVRWPFARRAADAALTAAGQTAQERGRVLAEMEARYKAPFPELTEESLAGGLSNTIAGRICAQFDLQGGGFTIDGACASSLLALAHAAGAVAQDELDVAVAGGVDVSLDPFELVGFAKAGALASERMRVYDRRPTGFWPGEGCGMVVLMPLDDARSQGRRVYGVLRGWGVSSDGSGAVTRPRLEGQLLALRRAYGRAGFGIDSVAYFEGHGTGTAVGDATEIRALLQARREAAAAPGSAALGSIKANIGHTKAAAGAAGLIKAAMALGAEIVPPTTGWDEPHPELESPQASVRLAREGRIWPRDRPLRAAISAMGFGGINVHAVLERLAPPRRRSLSPRDRRLLASPQDAELVVVAADDPADLSRKLAGLRAVAERLSSSELSDLSARSLETDLRAGASAAVRAAVVASSPEDLTSAIDLLGDALRGGSPRLSDPQRGVWLDSGRLGPRIGFLFPGQGVRVTRDGAAWGRRFESVAKLYGEADLPPGCAPTAAEFVQPAAITAALAGLDLLTRLGIKADVAIGHSLGELAAYCWGGAIEPRELVRLARERGAAITAGADPDGAMAGIGANAAAAARLAAGMPVVVAARNSPRQTVLAGPAGAIDAVIRRALERGVPATRLGVSHAFHSPLVAGAVPRWAEHLAAASFRPLSARVVSTVTGVGVGSREDLRDLLLRQLTSPVCFWDALLEARDDIGLWIEVGPGRTLTDLTAAYLRGPSLALQAGGESIRGLLNAAGAAFAAGVPVDGRVLIEGRVTRPFDPARKPTFIANPCELVTAAEDAATDGSRPAAVQPSPYHVSSDGPVAEPNDGSAAPKAGPAAVPLLRELIARRAELPPETVNERARLLSDLHLSSIAAAQLVATAARALGARPPADLTTFADATVAEVAEALEVARRAAGGEEPAEADERFPAGIDGWVRRFRIDWVERPLPRPSRPADTVPAAWAVLGGPDSPLARALRPALNSLGGRGVAVCLPEESDATRDALLLEAAQLVAGGEGPRRFLVVQHDGDAAPFARSLRAEFKAVATCVVTVPAGRSQAVAWIRDEAARAVSFVEARYDAAGVRRVPHWQLVPEGGPQAVTGLTREDVLLVTGGGKGITAECALGLARRTGVQLLLVGRSDPERDPELEANLDRIAGHGVAFRYLTADVTDPESVRRAVRVAESLLGPVTAVLHGAGANEPCRLASLTPQELARTLGPKLDGMANVLAAIDPARVRLLVAFGSLIARVGVPGEAHYALANDRLARATECWGREHPHCRCLAIEWSIWSGSGMGERLGRVDALKREGIYPISVDEGVREFCGLLTSSDLPSSVVVTGRFGNAMAVKWDPGDLPLRRFLEQPRVYVPGVELVADSVLSADADPYLPDHTLDGTTLVPAVVGMEAMAQAALAVASEPPEFESIEFESIEFRHAVTVPAERAVRIRVAVLVRTPGLVEAAVRSEETAFQVDHFRARCRLRAAPTVGANPRVDSEAPPEISGNKPPFLPLEPQSDLYGPLLFHTGRFRRIAGYRRLTARECEVELRPSDGSPWFGRYHPSAVVLGDLGARDAAIHAIQACFPQSRLLPTGADRWARTAGASEGRTVRARERASEGPELVYDVDVLGDDGTPVECWQGLRLRRVGRIDPPGPCPVPLLGPLLERSLEDAVGGFRGRLVVVAGGRRARRAARGRGPASLCGTSAKGRRRPDGRPEGAHDLDLSFSHAETLTLTVTGPGRVGCDVESVEPRPRALWRDLLGRERFALAELIAARGGEPFDDAATRVWAAAESMQKASCPPRTPLLLDRLAPDGWVVLSAGEATVAVRLAAAAGGRRLLAFAVLQLRSPAEADAGPERSGRQAAAVEEVGHGLV